MTTTLTALRAARLGIVNAHHLADTALQMVGGRASKALLLQQLRALRSAIQTASNNVVAAEKGVGGDMASAVLTLADGRGKVAQALAEKHCAVATEDDDGSSALYEFPDGSRLRVRLSAHVVERAETW